MSDIIDIPTNEGYLETPDPSPPASDDLSSNDFPSNISDLDSDDSDDDYDVSRLARRLVDSAHVRPKQNGKKTSLKCACSLNWLYFPSLESF